MNRRIILVVLVLVPLLSIGQNFENNDLIGKWKVIKTEFYIEGSFIRKVSLNEDNDTIVEGPDLAPMNEVFTDMVKSMTATIMHFDNNSFTWDVRNPELKIIKKYWTIKPNTVGFPESRPFKIRVKLEIINFTQRIFYEKDTLYRTSNYFYPAGAGKGTKSI